MVMKQKQYILQYGGIFQPVNKKVIAVKLLKLQKYIDNQGQQFMGLPGDYKVFDGQYIYFMNKHQFKRRYMPVDKKAFKQI